MFKKFTKKIPNIFVLLFLFLFFNLYTLASVERGLSQSNEPIVGPPPQKAKDRFIPKPDEYAVQTWVKNLRIPWELVFLSENKALVSERAGQVRVIENGILQEEPYKVIDKVQHIGEGGLMGMAKHPDYPDQRYLYLMYTYREKNQIYNLVARYYDTGNTLEFDQIIVEKIPGSNVHNGGRISFGPDGMLYITTGDTWEAELAQDMGSLGGKILRYTPDGEIPTDNPFDDSPVYSMGHRNPQGLAWHPVTGDLFSSEHGPSGEFGLYDKDIINVIQKGGNYGWPRVLGNANVKPYLDPIIMWPMATPPSGLTFWNEQLFLATLRSQALIRIDMTHSNSAYEVTAINRLFSDESSSGGTYGRLRTAVVGPDNALYVLTNNHDGRGMPQEGDDKILKLILK